MKPKLEWNVYIHDFIKRKIIVYNVLDHSGFRHSIHPLRQEEDREKFEREVLSSLAFFFRFKYEYEVTIFNWMPDPDFDYLHIDVFQQIKLNGQLFLNYLWENRKYL